jgi:hypothetical protein
MDVSINEDTQNGWFIGENHGKSIYKWMILGVPLYLKPPI